MTTLPVPRGHLAAVSDIFENDDGFGGASAVLMRSRFGRALQSDHAGAFDTHAVGVPTDSAAGVRNVRVRVGLPVAPTRG